MLSFDFEARFFFAFRRFAAQVIFFKPKANPSCIGIAGVNGPAQNAIYTVGILQNQLLTATANITPVIHGDQNISSAMIIHKSISLLSISRRNHIHAFLNFSFISVYTIATSCMAFCFSRRVNTTSYAYSLSQPRFRANNAFYVRRLKTLRTCSPRFLLFLAACL